MLLRARTIKAWGWAFSLLVRGGCARSPTALTPSITITKILAADGNDYDTAAAIEDNSVGVSPDRQVLVYTKSQKEERFEPRHRRRRHR